MSETGLIAINLPPMRNSVGISRSDSLAIIDENWISHGADSVDEIVVKDCILFNGSKSGLEEGESVFIIGWFRTELSLYHRPEKRGYQHGGEKVSPTEIDAVLMDHPGPEMP